MAAILAHILPAHQCARGDRLVYCSYSQGLLFPQSHPTNLPIPVICFQCLFPHVSKMQKKLYPLPLLVGGTDAPSCEVWKKWSKVGRGGGGKKRTEVCVFHYSWKVVNEIDELQIHNLFIHSHQIFLHLQLFCLPSKATRYIISLRDQEIRSLNLSRAYFMQN